MLLEELLSSLCKTYVHNADLNVLEEKAPERLDKKCTSLGKPKYAKKKYVYDYRVVSSSNNWKPQKQFSTDREFVCHISLNQGVPKDIRLLMMLYSPSQRILSTLDYTSWLEKYLRHLIIRHLEARSE